MRARQGPAGLLWRYEAGIVMKLSCKVDEAALKDADGRQRSAVRQQSIGQAVGRPGAPDLRQSAVDDDVLYAGPTVCLDDCIQALWSPEVV